VRVDARVIGAAPAVAGVVAVAGLAALIEPDAYPSYDYAFAMASAQDVLAGRGTGYQVTLYSPVPHPLTLLESIAVVPLGDVALAVFGLLALLGLGLLCVSMFAIGSATAGRPVGLLAAVLVFTSPAIFELAVRGYGDIWFAAFIAVAIALELRRARRGWPVLAVLGLAGLLRPEAWLLAAAYWLYLVPCLSRRARVALAGLVALAPAVWIAMDAVLTGDPWHSVAVTRLHDERLQALSPEGLWTSICAMAGWPALAGAVAGGLLAWRRNRAVASLLLVAGTAALLATVLPAALAGSAVLRRFLVAPASVISLFFAIGCLGWVAERSRPWRAGWIAVAVVVLGVLVALRAPLWESHHRRQAGRVMLLEQLRSWTAAPTQRAYLTQPACWPVRTPGYGYRPYLRYWLDVPPRAVAFRFHDSAPDGGSVLMPTAIDGYQRLMLADAGRLTRDRVLRDSAFTSRFRRVAHSSRWELYASAGCRRSVRVL
jgi:hypothetical protein